MRALEGIRILDLTQALAGPFSTSLLVGLGAEVIKIEPPWGDTGRVLPPLIKGKISPIFEWLNRGKKGMTLNLKTEKGKNIFLELVKHADIVVENFTPGTMDDLGLGYEKLKEINPKIIFASNSGFGQYGPYSKYPAYDEIIQASIGLFDLTRSDADSSLGGVYPKADSPIQAPDATCDMSAGMMVVIAVLTALYTRTVTGMGQRIDVAMTDLVAILPSFPISLNTGATWRETLYKFRVQLTGLLKCKDGWIAMAGGGRRLDNLAKEIGYEDRQALSREMIEKWMEERTVDEALTILHKIGVAADKVRTIHEVKTHPAILARNMIVEVDHPVVGKILQPGFPIQFSNIEPIVNKPAPTLGQHTEDILSTLLGYSKEEISKLKEEQIT